jgi:hypothetical protein
MHEYCNNLYYAIAQVFGNRELAVFVQDGDRVPNLKGDSKAILSRRVTSVIPSWGVLMVFMINTIL